MTENGRTPQQEGTILHGGHVEEEREGGFSVVGIGGKFDMASVHFQPSAVGKSRGERKV
jgi:hypothetical protein